MMHHREKGAALIEYVLILPFVLLLFLGTAEVFRVISIRQSLRAALQEKLPCLNHVKDTTFGAANGCVNLDEEIRSQVNRNPFAQVREVHLVSSIPLDVVASPDGAVFEVTAVAVAQYRFLYPFKGGPTFTLRESTSTFIDSSPTYFGMNPANELSVPEPIFGPMPEPTEPTP